MAAKLLKKITVADCGLDMKALLMAKIAPAAQTGVGPGDVPILSDVGPSVPLLRIMGVVVSAAVGMRTMPDGKQTEWLAFKGQFEATNLITGEVYQSGSCIMPGALPDMLYGAIKNPDGTFKNAEFAVEFGAHYDKGAVASYVFDTKTLLAPKESDAMASLKAQVAAAVPALAAPAADGAAPAPAAADATEANKAPTGNGKKK